MVEKQHCSTALDIISFPVAMSMNTLLFVGLIVAAVILFSVFGDSDEIEDEIEDEFEDTIEDGLEGGARHGRSRI